MEGKRIKLQIWYDPQIMLFGSYLTIFNSS